MNRLLIGAAGLVLAGSVTAPGCLSQASAAPFCGGQNAAPQPVPYTCMTQTKTITFQGVSRDFSAVVNVNGAVVAVTFTMSAPLNVNVPIRIVHHEGISGAGGTSDQSQGFILAGQTTATLIDSVPCREGQLDIKAVFTADNQSQGRVGGPWIQNGTNCQATTTVPQSSTTVTPPSSTVPSPVATTTIPGTPSVPVESSAPTTGGGTHSTQLPVTGGNGAAVGIGLGLLVGGLLLLTAAVRRRAS